MGGSPLPYRGGKFSAFEGGVRVFCLFHWPKILGGHQHKHVDMSSMKVKVESTRVRRKPIIASTKHGITSSMLVSALDILPTFMSLAQAELPADRSYDGSDLSSFLHHVGQVRSLYHTFHQKTSHHVPTDEDNQFKKEEFLKESSRLLSQIFPPRCLIVQSMGAFTALRIGKYKV